jgi:hypothetical protein
LGFSEQEFNQHYRLWSLWQAVERKPTEFLAALGLPSALLNMFFEADSILDKLQRQKADRKGSNFGAIGQIIERLKAKKEKQSDG